MLKPKDKLRWKLHGKLQPVWLFVVQLDLNISESSLRTDGLLLESQRACLQQLLSTFLAGVCWLCPSMVGCGFWAGGRAAERASGLFALVVHSPGTFQELPSNHRRLVSQRQAFWDMASHPLWFSDWITDVCPCFSSCVALFCEICVLSLKGLQWRNLQGNKPSNLF